MTINSKTIRPELEYFGPFNNAFRTKAHTLVYWGYRGAMSRKNRGSAEETTITGYISKAINDRLRSFDCPVWCEDFSVMENRPENIERCEGRKRPQPDLIIEGNMRGRPEYVFEAKRLKSNGFGVGKYLGEDGLKCFIDGKYASRYDEAAMLGYIQSDTPGHWESGIKKKMNQIKSSLNLKTVLQNVNIINDLPRLWMSIHSREKTGRPISIYHILLDCRPGACD